MSDLLGYFSCVAAVVMTAGLGFYLWRLLSQSSDIHDRAGWEPPHTAQLHAPADKRPVLAGQETQETEDQDQADQVQAELTEDQGQEAWSSPVLAGAGSEERWLTQLASLANVSIYDRERLARLWEWAHSVARVAFVEFEGQLSPKLALHPYFQRATAGYEDVPAEWKSLHFLEQLCGVFRSNGFADLRSRREGLRLNEAGIEKFEADPGRWYP